MQMNISGKEMKVVINYVLCWQDKVFSWQPRLRLDHRYVVEPRIYTVWYIVTYFTKKAWRVKKNKLQE